MISNTLISFQPQLHVFQNNEFNSLCTCPLIISGQNYTHKKKNHYQLELDLETEGGSFDRGGSPKDVGTRLQGLSPGEGGVAGTGLQGGGPQGRCHGSYATPLEQCCNAGPTKHDNT